MAKGLLGKVEKDNSKKYNPIKRAPDINYEDLVKKEDIIKVDTKEITDQSVLVQNEMDTRNLFVNIRVNQGVRNILNGLAILGYGENCLETVSIIVEDFLSKLTPYELEKLEGLKDFYDKKDAINHEKRQQNSKRVKK